MSNTLNHKSASLYDDWGRNTIGIVAVNGINNFPSGQSVGILKIDSYFYSFFPRVSHNASLYTRLGLNSMSKQFVM